MDTFVAVRHYLGTLLETSWHEDNAPLIVKLLNDDNLTNSQLEMVVAEFLLGGVDTVRQIYTTHSQLSLNASKRYKFSFYFHTCAHIL